MASGRGDLVFEGVCGSFNEVIRALTLIRREACGLGCL